MTAAARVEMKGTATLARTIGSACDMLDDMTPAHRAAAGIVAAASTAAAPKRTGRLAGSISATTDKGKAIVNVDAPYAAPIHWGWEARGIQGSRFAIDAARNTEPDWIGEYQAEVTRAVGKVRGV